MGDPYGIFENDTTEKNRDNIKRFIREDDTWLSSYNNFQSDNQKYTTKEGRNNYNPDFNSTINHEGFKWNKPSWIKS